mmetsp:Transcript_43389/g.103154  ORF Transcript_43389/g.103154 Transcript_43389/m.103154 type:complete len:226 (+) Transcript_43389:869-1546(+)
MGRALPPCSGGQWTCGRVCPPSRLRHASGAGRSEPRGRPARGVPLGPGGWRGAGGRAARHAVVLAERASGAREGSDRPDQHLDSVQRRPARHTCLPRQVRVRQRLYHLHIWRDNFAYRHGGHVPHVPPHVLHGGASGRGREHDSRPRLLRNHGRLRRRAGFRRRDHHHARADDRACDGSSCDVHANGGVPAPVPRGVHLRETGRVPRRSRVRSGRDTGQGVHHVR